MAAYISHHFPKTTIDVVEIDPSIVRVAMEHFDFKVNDRLKVITCDGLKYIKDYALVDNNAESNNKYDIIMFDVDSKDSRIGMSCPPKPFVELEFLLLVNKCLKDTGFFVLNITCRDPTLRAEVIKDVKTAFGCELLSYQIPQEVNEIFFCPKTSVPEMKSKINKKHPAIKAFETVNVNVQDDLLDLSEAIKQIQLV